MARKEQTAEQSESTADTEQAAPVAGRRGLFRRKSQPTTPDQGAAADLEPAKPESGARAKPQTKREDKPGRGRLVVSIVVLLVLLATTLVTLDQVGKIRLPIKIPRFLTRTAAVAAGSESTVAAPETALPSAESEARRRLDLEEAPPEVAASEGAPAERGPAPAPEGEGAVITESQAALIEELDITPPPATGAGEVTDEQIKAAEKERLRKIGRVGIILSSMKPEIAAKTLEGMPEDQQVAVIRSMEEDKIAKILSQMPPEKSAKLAQALMR